MGRGSTDGSIVSETGARSSGGVTGGWELGRVPRSWERSSWGGGYADACERICPLDEADRLRQRR